MSIPTPTPNPDAGLLVDGLPIDSEVKLTRGFACLTRAPDGSRWRAVLSGATFDRAMTSWAYTRLDWISIVVHISAGHVRKVPSSAL